MYQGQKSLSLLRNLLGGSLAATASTASMDSLAVQIPAVGVLDSQQGRIRVWAYVDGDLLNTRPAEERALLDNRAGGSTDVLFLRRKITQDHFWEFIIGNTGPNWTKLTWTQALTEGVHVFDVEYSAAKVTVSVDGNEQASALTPYLPQNQAAYLNVGYDSAATRRWGAPIRRVEITTAAGAVIGYDIEGNDLEGTSLESTITAEPLAFRQLLEREGGHTWDLLDNSEALAAIQGSASATAELLEDDHHIKAIANDQVKAEGLYRSSHPAAAWLFEKIEAISPFGGAGRMFVFGGYATSGSPTGYFSHVEQLLFAFPGFKGVTPATLIGPASYSAAAGSPTNAWVFGGDRGGTKTTDVENYVFASPGTKGDAPASLANLVTDPFTACNASTIILVGGYTTGAIAHGETYLWAAPGSKGTDPANLSGNRYSGAAAGNSMQMFTFGGYLSGQVNTCEQYIFSTPGSKGSAPAALSGVRHYQDAAASSAIALVFGGVSGSAYISTNEHYVFATPATKGTVPANLSVARGISAAGSNNVNAFVGGGIHTSSGNVCSVTVDNYAFASLSSLGVSAANLDYARYSMSTATNAHGGLQ